MQTHQGPSVHIRMVEAHAQGGFTVLATKTSQKNIRNISDIGR